MFTDDGSIRPGLGAVTGRVVRHGLQDDGNDVGANRSPVDISDGVNRQVAATHGDAIVKLAVTVDDSCDVLNAFVPLHALPIWPGCVPVAIHGLIVRRRTAPETLLR